MKINVLSINQNKKMEKITMLFDGDISQEIRKMVAEKVATLENTDERKYLAVGDMAGILRYIRGSFSNGDIVYINGIGYPVEEVTTRLYDSLFFVVYQQGLTIYIDSHITIK